MVKMGAPVITAGGDTENDRVVKIRQPTQKQHPRI